MFLKTVVLLSALLGSVISEEPQCNVPMLNRYTPSIYPITEMPEKISTGENNECHIAGGFMNAMLEDYRSIGVLNDHELEKSVNALFSCYSSICENEAMIKKLEEPLVSAELVSLTVSRGKFFDPDYSVFYYLMDPYYWDAMAGVSYPIVEQEHFAAQNEAAFQIISKVCGHQKPTLKSDIFPEQVNKIFMNILVEHYVQYAFDDGLYDSLKMETNAETLKFLWGLAASKRQSHSLCIDKALTKDTERPSIARIREIAEDLGVTCPAPADSSSEPPLEYSYLSYEYTMVGAAPDMGPPSSGGAPGSPQSSAPWASPPSSSGPSFGFAPGS